MIVSAPFSVKDAAKFLQTTPQQIRRMIHAGDLSAVKVGRSFRIPQESIQAFLNKQK